MQIRKATKKDIPAILDLIKELAIFEKEPEAVEISEATLEEEGFSENPLFICFVAEKSEPVSEVVGIALVYYRFSTWKGRSLHLEDLIVRNSERGKGIGEALYKEVMHFANNQGIKRVAWEVLEWNEGAIRFYERSGAKLMGDWRVVHMDESGLKDYVEKTIEPI